MRFPGWAKEKRVAAEARPETIMSRLGTPGRSGARSFAVPAGLGRCGYPRGEQRMAWGMARWVRRWPHGRRALVGSYALLMMIIRGARRPGGEVSPEMGHASAVVPHALQPKPPRRSPTT